jgi:hypothetical protein
MQPDSDQNKVFVNDEGIIEVVLIGDQTEASFKHAYDRVQPLIMKLQAEGKPVYGLIDMTEETGYSLASDKAALDILESLTYDKLAMCNAPHAGVAKGIILATGREDNTKLFTSRDDALAWLHA